MEIITKENFNTTVNDNQVVIVDVYADWCGPCKMITPLLEKLSEELTDVKFVKLDADAEVNYDIMRSFAIQSIPTIMMFKDGELKQNLVGFQPKATLEAKIKAL